jgi:molybdate transport system substrate-binding protein
MEVTGCNMKEPVVQGKSHEDNKQIVELTISAASSLQNALNEIKMAFENDHPCVKITYNFGGSGSLQQQVSQGAPVDIYLSASQDNFVKLVQKGLILEKYRTNLVGNDLVLVVPKDSNKGIKSFKDLTKADKISIGSPDSVPAGEYAKETLEKLNVWTSVEDKVVNAKDVRQVLTYIETGNVDAGIVYKSDTLNSPKVKLIDTAEENTHDPIIYPVGVIKNSSHQKEAIQFYDYLQKKKSMEIFLKYEFKSLK